MNCNFCRSTEIWIGKKETKVVIGAGIKEFYLEFNITNWYEYAYLMNV
jgi:hypothetical protein